MLTHMRLGGGGGKRNTPVGRALVPSPVLLNGGGGLLARKAGTRVYSQNLRLPGSCAVQRLRAIFNQNRGFGNPLGAFDTYEMRRLIRETNPTPQAGPARRGQPVFRAAGDLADGPLAAPEHGHAGPGGHQRRAPGRRWPRWPKRSSPTRACPWPSRPRPTARTCCRARILSCSALPSTRSSIAGLDCEISAKYGVRMCSGDTIGPGGIFRTMREFPVILDCARTSRRSAPTPG